MFSYICKDYSVTFLRKPAGNAPRKPDGTFPPGAAKVAPETAVAPRPYFFSERFKKLCDLFFLSKPVRKSSRTASGCTKFKSIFIIALQYTSGKACHH